MGEVIVKTGVNLKGGNQRLDQLNQFPGMVHSGDGILKTHDVGMHLGKLKHRCGRNGVSGVVGKIIDIDWAMDFSGQPVVILKQGFSSEMEIVWRENHHRVGARVQTFVGKVDNLLRHHAGRANNQFHTMVDALNGKLCHNAALLHGHREKFAGTSLHQNSVNALFDQIVKKFSLTFQIQSSVFVE